jgi:hypothetical protein
LVTGGLELLGLHGAKAQSVWAEEEDDDAIVGHHRSIIEIWVKEGVLSLCTFTSLSFSSLSPSQLFIVLLFWRWWVSRKYILLQI